MHLNKLSTAALMRLSLLSALDLVLGRFIGYSALFHPLFFLILVTLNLGLYAVMVYTGTLNKTLIAMMLAGLAGVLAVIAYGGMDASAFGYGGPYRWLAERIEELVNRTIGLFPKAGFRAPPKRFWQLNGIEVGYFGLDAIGLGAIISAGLLARALQARASRREPAAVPPLS